MAVEAHVRNWWETGVAGRPSTHARRWTPDRYWHMLEMIEGGKSDREIAEALDTTHTAVTMARRRAQLPAGLNATLSALGAANLLGYQQSRQVVRWIEAGYLPAERGHDTGYGYRHIIQWDDLFAFLENPDYWHLWDVERITDPLIRARCAALPRPRYLTPKQAAARLHVEPITVRQWVRYGVLRGYWRGFWLIAEPDLENFVPPRDRPGKKPWRPYTADEDKILMELRDSGVKWRDIAERLGRHTGSLTNRYNRLKREAK